MSWIIFFALTVNSCICIFILEQNVCHLKNLFIFSIRVTEERAQKFEERAEKAENKLISCEEKIRALEKQLVDCRRDPVAYLTTISTNEPAESSLHTPKSSVGGKTGKKSAGKNVKSKKK